MTTIQLDAFITTANREINLSFLSGVSPDKMIPLSATRELFEVIKNDYRAYCPVRYSIKNIPVEHRYIMIQLEADIQLGRLEIGYDPE
jgi:hypothetical protein